jgi:hypothetical protein
MEAILSPHIVYWVKFGESAIEIDPDYLLFLAAPDQRRVKIGQVVEGKEGGLADDDLAIVELLREMQIIFPHPCVVQNRGRSLHRASARLGNGRQGTGSHPHLLGSQYIYPAESLLNLAVCSSPSPLSRETLFDQILRENGSISASQCPQPIVLPNPLGPIHENAGPLAGILRG